MKREEMRELAVKSIDGLISDLENAVIRGTAVFGVDELLTSLIPSFVGIAKTEQTGKVYTGEIRDIGLMLNPMDQPWADTIAQVSSLAKQGQIHDLFKPGDYLIMPVSVPETDIDGAEFPAINDFGVKLVITYVYKNFMTGGSGAVFNFENALFRSPVNPKCTNKGGFVKSTLAKYLNGHFLKHVFGEVEQHLMPNKDGLKVSLPTLQEVFGNNEDDKVTNWGDTVRHPYFTKCTNRIKVNNNEQDDTNCWWLSTASDETTFCYVNTRGYVTTSYAIYAYGVAPAFCVA